jgi:hypothetical protein
MHCVHALGKALDSCRSVLDARRGWFLVPRSAHLCASAESASLPWASSWRPKTDFFLHRAFLLDARSGTVFNATARRLHQHRWRAWACRRSARSKCNWVQEPGRGGHESALRGRRFADHLLWKHQHHARLATRVASDAAWQRVGRCSSGTLTLRPHAGTS